MEGLSTEFSIETSRDMDWTCLGLLSRWNKVCRVFWAIIKNISSHWQIPALTTVSVVYHCDFHLWKLLVLGLLDDVLSIYQPSLTEIRWSITEKIANNIFAKNVYSWPWPFYLRPSYSNQVFPLSSTTDQPNEKGWVINKRVIADFKF